MQIIGKITQTIKRWASFGAVTVKNAEVTRPVEPPKPVRPETPNDPLTEKRARALDEQLKIQLVAINVPATPEKLAELKAQREKMAALWSTNTTASYSPDDAYIEGVETGTKKLVDNTNNATGVRFSFKSKK